MFVAGKAFDRRRLTRMGLHAMSLARWVRPRPKAYAVLTYHHVMNEKAGACSYCPDSYIDRGRFQQQMQFLSEKCVPIPLNEMVDRLLHGIEPDAFYVAVTFDDGYLSSKEVAWPILRSYDVPATFFITTDFIDQKYIPWWDEWWWRIHRINRKISVSFGHSQYIFDLRLGSEKLNCYSRLCQLVKGHHSALELFQTILNDFSDGLKTPRYHMNWDDVRWLCGQSGVSIGAHGVTHQRSKDLRAHYHDEMVPSKSIIEEQLDEDIDLYALPWGTTGEINSFPGAIDLAGFKAVFTSAKGFNGIGDSFHKLKRISVVGSEDLQAFLTRLYMADLLESAERLPRYHRMVEKFFRPYSNRNRIWR